MRTKKPKNARPRACQGCGCDLTATKVEVESKLPNRPAAKSMQLRRPPAVDFSITMVGNGTPFVHTQTWCVECTEKYLNRNPAMVMSIFWARLARHITTSQGGS